MAAVEKHLTQHTSPNLSETDEHGIVRSSGTGVTLVPWGDVSAVRSYSCGYMLVLKRGTLPIPFRCLSATQAGAMDCFAAALRASR